MNERNSIKSSDGGVVELNGGVVELDGGVVELDGGVVELNGGVVKFSCELVPSVMPKTTPTTIRTMSNKAPTNFHRLPVFEMSSVRAAFW